MSLRRVIRPAAAVAVVGAAAAVAVAAGHRDSGGRTSGATSERPAAIAPAASGGAASASARFDTSRAGKARAATEPIVGTATFDGVSPAARDLPAPPARQGPLQVREIEQLKPAQNQRGSDPVVQTAVGDAPMPDPLVEFDGLCLVISGSCATGSNCGCLPPDPTGEVGPNHYVQAVNTAFAVYSRTGSQLLAPKGINQLWAGKGGECEIHNDGDPIVLYDQLADRWLLSQFVAGPNDNEQGHQYGECVAISQTPDPTGSYYLYTFLFGPSAFHDYPHFGVWPDGYYMSTHKFNSAGTYQGAGFFAFERDKMLAGQTARVVQFDLGTSYGGQLPSDLDGSTPPPPGSPNYFVAVDDTGTTSDTMRIWKFDVDWANPSSSTLGVGAAHDPNSNLSVANFDAPVCVYGYGANCNPQRNTAQTLDTIGDRLMFRAAYRNFGTHESMVINHSVVVAPRNGIRWYEVRGLGGTPTVHQQSTYAPTDPAANQLWRWMGSIAMDRAGNIALGFSASGPNNFPGLRYVGRLASDPLSQLPQAETVLHEGNGSQTEVMGRWGDYSHLAVDPTDDCTFWYTNEYLQNVAVVLGIWRTRVGAFKFPSCGSAPTTVTVSRFSARWTKAGVALAWKTGTEATVLGFNVWRTDAGKASWRKVNRALIVAKRSGQAAGGIYRFVDRTARRGRFSSYRLQFVDLNGKRSWYGIGTTPSR